MLYTKVKKSSKQLQIFIINDFSSVSNKNWVYKKFNNDDVLFYKENSSLDEITSKLLSIRKIKKEDISKFY